MKLKLNNNVTIIFKENKYMEFVKGIWNKDILTLQLEESVEEEKEIINIFSLVQKGEEVIISENIYNKFFDVFNHLVKYNYLYQTDKKPYSNDINKILKQRKILLVVSEEFLSILNFSQYKDLDYSSINEIIEKIGLNYNSNKNYIDEYDYINLLDTCKNYFRNYKEIILLLKNPNINIVRILNKIFTDLEINTNYSIIDNELFFNFVCIPNETACFQCFEYRIRSRIDKYPEITYFNNININMHNKLTDENITCQLVMDFTLKLVIQDLEMNQKKFIGNVLIMDLITFEIKIEKLYRIPYCEGCNL